MKKPTCLALAGLVLISAVLLFPTAAAGVDIEKCYQDHLKCRESALNLDAPWYKVTLILTVCDLALAKCILPL